MTDRSSTTETARESIDADDLNTLPISALIPALTYAFDLKGMYPKGHALRTCAIGMQSGAKTGLSEANLGDLYYALLFAPDCTLRILTALTAFNMGWGRALLNISIYGMELPD